MIEQLQGGDSPFDLTTVRIAALPIVDRYLQRLRLDELLARHLPHEDARTTLAVSRTIGVVVRNLALGREPLYAVGEWAARHEPGLLGLDAGDADRLNDDRVGRALGKLFDADRATMLSELIVGAIAEFEVDCSQLHNDSTSITLHGAYTGASELARGKAVPMPKRGHSKDHRPDLKQLVLILTVSRDGAVPIVHRLVDGNITDDTTHIETWDTLVGIAGRAGFLYVADSKLCTGTQMRHIDAAGGRFVTILPRTRKEATELRSWLAADVPTWTEAERRQPRRKADTDDVWSTTPAPFPSAEGYRIVVVHSTSKQRRDESSRQNRLDRARHKLDELNTKLASPRARSTNLAHLTDTIDDMLAPLSVDRYLAYSVKPYVEERYRQEKRGRPGTDTRYRKLTKHRFRVSYTIDADTIRTDAASDGCFPLITNDQTLTDTELLAAYRYQPNLEKRHHELKGVMDATPVALHTTHRIDALFACQFIALLCRSLIERDLRTATQRTNTTLPLYPEGRNCPAPTTARLIDLFHNTARHHLSLIHI